MEKNLLCVESAELEERGGEIGGRDALRSWRGDVAAHLSYAEIGGLSWHFSAVLRPTKLLIET
jgi:hypothetical protein